MLAVSVAVEKAVVVPLTVTFAVSPATPVVLSQARKVMVALPFQLALGIKRILCVLAPVRVPSSRRAALADGLPKASQVLPSSTLYCQVPLVLSTAVTAMASTALPSGSVMLPSTMIAATVSPAGLARSSAMVVSTGDTAALSTGALWAAVTEMLRVSLALEYGVMPPLLLVLAVLPAVPLVLSQARKVSVALPL